MRDKYLTREIATIGLLIAMEIICTRFLSISTPYLRVDFAFIPIALCAMLYGPLKAGVAAAVGNIIGVIFFSPFALFPGFTFSAFLTGVVFGLFLYRKPKSVIKFAVPVVILCIVKNLGLDTLWVVMISAENFFALTAAEVMARFIALMPVRVVHLIMVPVQIITLSLLWKHVMGRIENQFVPEIENTVHE